MHRSNAMKTKIDLKLAILFELWSHLKHSACKLNYDSGDNDTNC